MREQLRASWLSLTTGLGVEAAEADRVFVTLAAQYSHPERHYHNLRHLGEVLALVDELEALAANPEVVRLGAWFHDAVYDPRAADNEERSSDLAAHLLRPWPLPSGSLERVRQLILLTRTHQPPAGDPDAAVLLDADLGILGATPQRYADYARGIREEYDWVPEEKYRPARAAVLRRFLDRPRIYRTELLFTERESQARRNLAAEILDLVGL